MHRSGLCVSYILQSNTNLMSRKHRQAYVSPRWKLLVQCFIQKLSTFKRWRLQTSSPPSSSIPLSVPSSCKIWTSSDPPIDLPYRLISDIHELSYTVHTCKTMLGTVDRPVSLPKMVCMTRPSVRSSSSITVGVGARWYLSRSRALARFEYL